MSDALAIRDMYLNAPVEIRDQFVDNLIVGDIAQRLGTNIREFYKDRRDESRGVLRKLMIYMVKNPNRQLLMDAIFEEKIKAKQ